MTRRVDFLLGDLGLGGAQAITVGLARALGVMGWRCRILACAMDGLIEAEAREAVELVKLGARAATSVPQLFRSLRADRPDFIISSQATGLILGGVAQAAGTVIQHVAMIHGFRSQELAQGGSVRWRIALTASRAAAARAHRILCVSRAAANAFAGEHPAAASRIIVLPNGPISERDILNERKCQSTGSIPLILFAGRFAPDKDPIILIETLGLLLKTRRVRAVFLGSGELENSMRLCIEAAGIGHAVRIEPPRRPIQPTIDASDLLVLPSVAEPFGNVLIEAMARGVPVLAFSGSGGPDELLAGIPRALVAPRTAAALAEAIERVLDNPPAPRVLTERAQLYTIERQATGLAAILGDYVFDPRL